MRFIDETQKLAAVGRRERVKDGPGVLGGQRGAKVLGGRHVVLAGGTEVEADRVADADARGAPHAAVDVQPLTFATHRDESGVDRDAVEGVYDPAASGGGVGGEGLDNAFGDVNVGVRPLLVER